jgi:hypothetical protein
MLRLCNCAVAAAAVGFAAAVGVLEGDEALLCLLSCIDVLATSIDAVVLL